MSEKMAKAKRSTEHTCCLHMAGAPFVVNTKTDDGSTGSFQVVPRICCHCGPLHVLFIGIREEGHGSFLEYQPAIQRPRVLIPSGLQVN